MHFLAPLLLVIAAFSLYAVLPVGRNMVLANLDAGVLFFFAVSSVMETRHLHGRLVEPQQVFAVGSDAGNRADDQL